MTAKILPHNRFPSKTMTRSVSRDIELVYLRRRMARFGLELHPDKTRLIEFGRFAARNRDSRGLGKPETFDFLGFTHICGTTRNGWFKLKRVTIAKRMRTALVRIKDELKRRMHQPIPELGRWLASVVRGHMAYYAVPGNAQAVGAFRTQVTRHWLKTLRRRSQRTTITWARTNRLARSSPWPGGVLGCDLGVCGLAVGCTAYM